MIMRTVMFCTHMELHCSKTTTTDSITVTAFCTHMELHCSKTKGTIMIVYLEFCTHMELHCSKTHITLKKRVTKVLYPYGITLL